MKREDEMNVFEPEELFLVYFRKLVAAIMFWLVEDVFCFIFDTVNKA